MMYILCLWLLVPYKDFVVFEKLQRSRESLEVLVIIEQELVVQRSLDTTKIVWSAARMNMHARYSVQARSDASSLAFSISSHGVRPDVLKYSPKFSLTLIMANFAW